MMEERRRREREEDEGNVWRREVGGDKDKGPRPF
jgi:hypothetical protein